MSDFDFTVLDAPRDYANAELGRVIADFFGYVEPHLPETDSWCSMPLRLVHDQAGGWHLELGPYTLDIADIRLMQAAIASYYQATGNPPLKVVD